MRSYRTMIATVIAIYFCFAVSLGEEKISFPKNCSADAIAISGQWLQNDNSYISASCYDAYAECAVYDLATPREKCVNELDMPDLKDIGKYFEYIKNTENNYFAVLQMVCCVETQISEFNGITFDKMYETTKKCIVQACGKP